MGSLKHTYFFPNFVGRAMARVDMRTQLEASMVSMTLILIGLILTTVYILFFVAFPLWYKITVVINLLAGFGFITSNLVTTFQQYQSYLSAVEFQAQLKDSEMKGGSNA